MAALTLALVVLYLHTNKKTSVKAVTGFRNPGRYPKNPAVFLGVNPPKKTRQKTHPKFNPVSFLMLLITKYLIMFKAFNSTSSAFAK